MKCPLMNGPKCVVYKATGNEYNYACSIQPRGTEDSTMKPCYNEMVKVHKMSLQKEEGSHKSEFKKLTLRGYRSLVTEHARRQ